MPIAFGYMLAHYFSLLVLDGQAIGYLVSDPLGHGSDLFGTANFLINYNLISFAAIWYVQIAAIVAGHVSGLILSHEQRPDRVQVPRSRRPLAVLDARDHGRLHLPGTMDPLRGHHHDWVSAAALCRR